MEPVTEPPHRNFWSACSINVKVGIIWLVVLSSAMSTSFPAIAIPALAEAGFELTPSQVSLVGTMRQVGIIIGALTIGPLLDNWGRRKGIVVSILPIIAGYAIMLASDCVVAVCSGLILEGIAMGMLNSSTAIYLAEILSKEWRGAIGVARQVLMSVGLTLTYIFALFIQDKISMISLIALIPTSLSLVLALCFISETKIWTEQSMTSSGKIKQRKSFADAYIGFFKALISRPDIYKPFCMLNFLNLLRHGSGSGVITNYTITMITDSGATSDPYVIAVILGVFRTAASIIGAVLSKMLGRKPTMLGAGVLMTLSMVGLALQQYLEGLPRFAPEIILVVFISTSGIFQSISISLQGEIYPTDFRGMCSSATITLSNVEAAFVLFTYPLAKSWIGNGFLMAIYALCNASCLLFTHCTVPNTDNKTLDEISKMYQKPSSEEAVLDEAVPLRFAESSKNNVPLEKSRNEDT